MQVFVSYLGEIKCFHLSNYQNIDDLILMVQESFNIEELPSLYNNCLKIERIEDVSSISTLTALSEVVGGGKKRGAKKRKPHTTPKKNKHKHQNVKLRALSYYAISNNKAEPVKRLCDSKICQGKGIFMANHWNRHYCGNCHLVYIKADAPKEEPKRVKAVAQTTKVAEAPAAKGKAKGKKK